MLNRIGGCGPFRCWLSWLEVFMLPRDFEGAWDGSVWGRGPAAKGVPQGSPLSPVLLLVFMAPILEEMERRVKEEVRRVDVQFPWYVDDLHCGLYDKRVTGEEEAKRVQEYGILPHSRTYYCLLFSLYHMFIIFVISY